MPYARDRLRKFDDSPNADTVFVEFDINQPRVYERYYSIYYIVNYVGYR